VVDALVATTAAAAGALLVTDDPADMRALADAHLRGLRPATLQKE
jgi:predicted nucleic acid-binding protein